MIKEVSAENRASPTIAKIIIPKPSKLSSNAIQRKPDVLAEKMESLIIFPFRYVKKSEPHNIPPKDKRANKNRISPFAS